MPWTANPLSPVRFRPRPPKQVFGGFVRLLTLLAIVLIAPMAVAAPKNETKNFRFNELIVEAADSGDLSTVSSLLTQNKSPDTRAQFGVTALMRAVYRGDEAIAKKLIKAGADVNATDQAGATALHIASRQGRASMIALLVGAGADVNAMDNSSWTPLMRATMARSQSSVKLLLKAGSKLLLENRWKQNSLDILAQSGNAAMLKLYDEALQGQQLPPIIGNKMETYAKWNPDLNFRQAVTSFTHQHSKPMVLALKPAQATPAESKFKIDVKPRPTEPVTKPEVPLWKVQEAMKANITPPPVPVAVKQPVDLEKLPQVTSSSRKIPLLPIVRAGAIVAEENGVPKHISSYPPEMRAAIITAREKAGASNYIAPSLPIVELPKPETAMLHAPKVEPVYSAKPKHDKKPHVKEQTLPTISKKETGPGEISPPIWSAAEDSTSMKIETLPVLEGAAINNRHNIMQAKPGAEETLYARETSRHTASVADYEGPRHDSRKRTPVQHERPMLAQQMQMMAEDSATPTPAIKPEVRAHIFASKQAKPEPNLLDLMAANPPPAPIDDKPTVLAVLPTKGATAKGGSAKLTQLMEANPAPADLIYPAEDNWTESRIQVAKPIRVAKGQSADNIKIVDPKQHTEDGKPFAKHQPPQVGEHAKHPHKHSHHHTDDWAPTTTTSKSKQPALPRIMNSSDKLLYPLWITSAYFANATLAGSVVDELIKMPEMAAYQVWMIELSGDSGYGLRVGPFYSKSAVKDACGAIRNLRHLKVPMQGSCMLEVQQADRSFIPAQALVNR